MAEPSEFDDNQIRAFLLGTLPTALTDEVQRRVAQDAHFRESVEAVEEELFDDYARRRLRGADAARFKSKYLSTPEGRGRLEFAQAFVGKETTRFSIRAIVFTATAGVILCGISFLAVRMLPTRVVGIELRPGVVRESAPDNVFAVPRSTLLMEFRLYPEQPMGERARLLTLEETEITSGPTFALPDGGRQFLIPAQILQSGTYIIRLDHGATTTASFVVRVTKK